MRRAAFALATMLVAPLHQVQAAGFDCLIDPSMSVKVGSPVSGVVASVTIDRGDRVAKGQVLAELDSTMEAATVEVDRARAENTADISEKFFQAALARSDFSRAQQLRPGETVTAQKLEQLRTAVDVAQQELALATLNHRLAQLELDHARASLEQRTIRSPIDGMVTQRSLGPGEYIHETASVATIAAIDPLFVEAYPPVALQRRIHVGDSARVLANPPDASEHVARVSVVDQVFDPASGTFGLRLVLPNPGNAIPAGLRCKVMFDGITDPEAAAVR